MRRQIFVEKVSYLSIFTVTLFNSQLISYTIHKLFYKSLQIKMSMDEFRGTDEEPSAKRIRKTETTLPDHLILEFDGSSKINPRIAAGGWCLVDAELAETDDARREVAHGWYYVGDKNTNNEAEYYGLIHALEMLHEKGFKGRVDMRGDSNLVIQQVQGKWKCKSPNLIPLLDKVRGLVRKMSPDVRFHFSHVERAKNKAADGYANQGVNLKERFCQFTSDTV